LGKDAKNNSDGGQNDLPDMEDNDSEEEEHGPPDAANMDNIDNIDNNIDELNNLDADACEELIADTVIVHAMVLKVKRFIFSTLLCLLISFHSTALQAVFFNHMVDHYCAPHMMLLLQGFQTKAMQPSS
jgi:hypothetical protein